MNPNHISRSCATVLLMACATVLPASVSSEACDLVANGLSRVLRSTPDAATVPAMRVGPRAVIAAGARTLPDLGSAELRLAGEIGETRALRVAEFGPEAVADASAGSGIR